MKWLALVICIVTAACEHGKGGGIPPVDGGGSGVACGGFAGTQCPITEFCDFGRNSCGSSDEQGPARVPPAAPICSSRPAAAMVRSTATDAKPPAST
jgi:hypothetical protein